MTRKVTSYRLPEMTLNQIKSLTESTGSSDANVIAFAIDRMYQQEIKTMSSKMTEQQARKLAEEAVEYADTEGHHLGGTIIVGIDLTGKFWVTDNGEEVSGLTEQGAIDIIIENLTATKE